MAQIIAATYEVEKRLASGGGGVVYLARHLRLGKQVVLKADKRSLTARVDDLRREVDSLKNLSHTYIPQVYDFFVEDGTVYTVMDYIEGDEAGLKSASIMVEGMNAYGFLKSENGVHRLVRISPFDSNARRQTSFAAVEVIPEITDDSKDVEIRPEDIEMQVYRSSGAGGQHINKTSSAVRLIHKPTGIVVSCQTQRDQFQNRETCMRMLRSKLIEIKEREHLDKISDIKGAQLKIEWGSQIRNYVFMPYTLVKDTRTGFETSNVNAVMDGALDGFINAYLTCLATNTWVTKS